MRFVRFVGLLLLATLPTVTRAADWQERLAKDLPLLGHRNWVVIADSAYPAQTAPGIQTIYIGGDQVNAVSEVLTLIGKQLHVRPKVICDSELEAVSNEDAPGIDDYRKRLSNLLKGKPVTYLPHEQVIERLDGAAQTFRVVILKTDLALPYTSVFIELDCGYWSDQAEQRLRERMKK